MSTVLGVGVLGAHAWAEKAHLPGYAACARVRRVALCDPVRERAEALAGEFAAVSASMRNFVSERAVRGKPGQQRVPIDDGTVALVEFASGAQGVLQTSFIAVGNYPGVELRVDGSRGAAVARLVVENGIAETLHAARADAVEFRPVVPAADTFPPGTDVRMPWPELYYRNLVRLWADEILDGGPGEGTFEDGARSQEIVDAIMRSHTERRWVSLPLDGVAA